MLKASTVLVLVLSWITAQAVATEDQDSARLLRKALQLREKYDATADAFKQAASVLVNITGLRAKIKTHELPGLPVISVDSSRHVEIPGFPNFKVYQDAQPDALAELGKALQDGQGIAQHMVLALALFKLAAAGGSAAAHGEMALRYALGLHELASWERSSIRMFGQPDESLALLHYYYGAMGGDALSRVALGYRHLHGLGVPRSCTTASLYYQPVAEQVVDVFSTTGMLPQVERIRLSIAALSGQRDERQKDVVAYYQHSADAGNVDAQTAVGQVLNYGLHGIARDHAEALRYLQLAADAGDADAAAHLGHMHANGHGTAPDLQMAAAEFTAAARKGSSSALYALGYMHLSGRGAEQDYDKAFKYLSQAVEKGHPDAHFLLGALHLKGVGVRRPNAQRAFTLFALASHAGHLLASYNTAMMHATGKGTPRACKPAVTLFKSLAEKGIPGATLQRAHESFFRGASGTALWQYLRAAEVGVEVAQANAAWMMDRGYLRAPPPGAPVPSFAPTIVSLLRRSSEQGNVASTLALGDAHFYGTGTAQDWSRAAVLYYEAYTERSAQAMYNLGFMHEFGAGVPQDLRLARKFYNMASHTQPDAYAAMLIANGWLVLHEGAEVLRSLLPQPLAQWVARAITLAPPHTSLLGPWWSGVGRALMPGQLLMQAEVGVRQMLGRLGLDSLAGDGVGSSDLEDIHERGSSGSGRSDDASEGPLSGRMGGGGSSSDPASANGGSESLRSDLGEDDLVGMDQHDETLLLLGLSAVLLVVLRARQQRAARRAAAAAAAGDDTGGQGVVPGGEEQGAAGVGLDPQ